MYKYSIKAGAEIQIEYFKASNYEIHRSLQTMHHTKNQGRLICKKIRKKNFCHDRRILLVFGLWWKNWGNSSTKMIWDGFWLYSTHFLVVIWPNRLACIYFARLFVSQRRKCTLWWRNTAILASWSRPHSSWSTHCGRMWKNICILHLVGRENGWLVWLEIFKK